MADRNETGTNTRAAAIVIVATMLLWMGGSMLGGEIGLPVRYAFLLDFAALGGFAWALIVLCRAWRKGREEGK
ncbi:hypothetical protein FDP22_15130 [Paroceanicella profunda]|uniref:DUF5337 domain-containing protein n=1 Tax=Paroceanicella profunda TaxID=2579971 RepID=A0A5B8FHY2_9RHOB|nr:DUF5337 domain-containing protein [Paroceanicella profunda]QDL93001.1 hypothetical protein FDP22_15130 [Paroceanicella profunda]